LDNSIIKLNIATTIYNENPQDAAIRLINSELLLNHTDYNKGIKTLSSLTNVPSGSSPDELTVEDIEESFTTQYETLSEDNNTIIIFSEKPFDLQINDGSLLIDLYHFSYSSDRAFSIYVANHSTTDDVILQYVTIKSKLLGSSYVYT
jgi:hypothetical protein